MERLNLKPKHKPVQNYYEALRQFEIIGVSHEGAVRSAFQTLLEHCSRQFQWQLVPEWQIRKNGGRPLQVDGAVVDEYRITHGFWEEKDTPDDLAKEAEKKIAWLSAKNTIIFLAPDHDDLMHNSRIVLGRRICLCSNLIAFESRND